MTAVLAGVAAAAAAFLAFPAAAAAAAVPTAGRPVRASGEGWVHRGRLVWPVLAVAGCWVVVGGWPGLAAGLVTALVVRHLVAGAEPLSARRERESVRRDLPVLVLLLGTALRGGADVGPALRLVCAALPGPASARLAVACDRLAVGAAVDRVWEQLAEDPGLAPLGRSLARAQRSGAPVAGAVERLADDLAETARAEVTDRARAVGVRAAVPLGVCLLPSFLLLGIVPLVASLVSGLEL